MCDGVCSRCVSDDSRLVTMLSQGIIVSTNALARVGRGLGDPRRH